MKNLLIADIGGTNTRLRISDLNGNILWESVTDGVAAAADSDAPLPSFTLLSQIVAAGRASFVVAFMEKAKECGCKVGAIVNNLDTDMAKLADISVEALTGAEVIKGSTRMKAGSAQKMILNMFSTAVFVKSGYTWQNYMTHMNPSNSKLRKRAITMVCEITKIQPDEAQKHLISHDWDIHAALCELTQ